MNWLERAREEIQKRPRRPTAESAERSPTAAMAVPSPTSRGELDGSIGSNGSAPLHLLEPESLLDAYEERAAIMEFEGGLSREEAEREAWTEVSKAYRHRLEKET